MCIGDIVDEIKRFAENNMVETFHIDYSSAGFAEKLHFPGWTRL